MVVATDAYTSPQNTQMNSREKVVHQTIEGKNPFFYNFTLGTFTFSLKVSRAIKLILMNSVGIFVLINKEAIWKESFLCLHVRAI